MSANDVYSLSLLYEEWQKTRLINGKAPRDLNVFEYFCAEQFLKRFSLNDEEILRGMVGDKDDGGIDSFHFFINRVLADDSTEVDRRSENDVDVIVMQMKENKGFSPGAVEKMDRFTDDLLDLQRGPDGYRYAYKSRLQDLMTTFKDKMRTMAHANLRIEYYFVSKVDEPPNDNCLRATKAMPNTVRKHFSKADVAPVNFAGAQQLYDQTKVRPPAKKHLTFEKSFDTREGWIGLVPLKTFYEFLKDADSSSEQLNETIFDDNVRGYYLNTPINRAISATLGNYKNEPEFWLLNNGITILTPSASLKSGVLEIKDPQIVNGLQTSRRIFDYFRQSVAIPQDDTRRILIRVIQNDDPEIRDEIIRATNNQNKMAPEALIATSRLHKQLDAFFAQHGLYYDRRKGHYKDQQKEISKIVSILTVVQAVVAIILRKPDDARGRPRDYVTKEKKRWSVFGPDDYGQPAQAELLEHKAYDLKVYLQCVRILRRVDQFIQQPKQRLDHTQQRNLRFYLALHVACALAKNGYCPPGALLESSADIDTVTDDDLLKYLKTVKDLYERHGDDDDAAKGPHMAEEFRLLLIAKYSPPNATQKKRKAKGARAGAKKS